MGFVDSLTHTTVCSTQKRPRDLSIEKIKEMVEGSIEEDIKRKKYGTIFCFEEKHFVL